MRARIKPGQASLISFAAMFGLVFPSAKQCKSSNKFDSGISTKAMLYLEWTNIVFGILVAEYTHFSS